MVTTGSFEPTADSRASGGSSEEPAGERSRRHLVFIGPPGAGKTTVGRLVAAVLHRPFVDTDALVQEREGRTIPDIFVESGEAYFREVERRAVLDALDGPDGVVSLGGGAILAPESARALGPHLVVFLDVELRAAARRSGFDQGRPLLALNPRGRWLELMQQRRPLYEGLAQMRVVTDDREPGDIADEVVAGCVGKL